MGANGHRSQEQVREAIARERERLTEAVGELRDELGDATDVAARMRGRLPVLAAGALGLGFVLGGGVGATMRYAARRGREHDADERLSAGRFAVVERR